METSTNASTIATILPIIVPIITYFLGIFTTPLRKFVHSENKEYCAFDSHLTLQDRKDHKHETMREIIVTKSYGKTKNINCPYFKNKDTEIKKHNCKKYLYCRYGKTFDPKIDDRKCPFYK